MTKLSSVSNHASCLAIWIHLQGGHKNYPSSDMTIRQNQRDLKKTTLTTTTKIPFWSMWFKIQTSPFFVPTSIFPWPSVTARIAGLSCTKTSLGWPGARLVLFNLYVFKHRVSVSSHKQTIPSLPPDTKPCNKMRETYKKNLRIFIYEWLHRIVSSALRNSYLRGCFFPLKTPICSVFIFNDLSVFSGI